MSFGKNGTQVTQHVLEFDSSGELDESNSIHEINHKASLYLDYSSFKYELVF